VKKQPKSSVRISVISPLETSDWNVGQELLAAFQDVDARLVPQKVGTFEPLKHAVSCIDDCAPFWAISQSPNIKGLELNADGFIWKRTNSVKSYGHMMHKHRNIYGDVRDAWFVFGAASDRKIVWLPLFKRICEVLQPRYATLNILGSVEESPNAFGKEADASYATNDHLCGLAPIALERRGLANLAAVNFFGPDSKGEVSEERIREAGFPIERFGHGFLVQVAEDVFAAEDDFAEFARRRSELRKLFREGLFRINHEPSIVE